MNKILLFAKITGLLPKLFATTEKQNQKRTDRTLHLIKEAKEIPKDKRNKFLYDELTADMFYEKYGSKITESRLKKIMIAIKKSGDRFDMDDVVRAKKFWHFTKEGFSIKICPFEKWWNETSCVLGLLTMTVSIIIFAFLSHHTAKAKDLNELWYATSIHLLCFLIAFTFGTTILFSTKNYFSAKTSNRINL